MQKQRKTSRSDFIIGMDAFHAETKVVRGKRLVQGERAGGFVIAGKIRAHDEQRRPTGRFVETIEEVKKEANQLWKHEYVGCLKQIWIKQDGIVVAFHSNFDFERGKKGVLKKVFVKK